MLKKILVIEDDKHTQGIWNELQDEATEIYHSSSGADAHSYFMRHNIALVILQLRISETNGLFVLQQLHKKNPVPILALSREPSKDEEVLALQSGADKYLGEPFDAECGLEHARALIRRYELDEERFSRHTSVLEFGYGLKVDLKSRTAYWQGNQLNLTPKQYMILTRLATEAGEVVTKEQLYSDVWNEAYDIYSDQALKSQIKGLRKELAQFCADRLIKTVWSVGYRLNPV